MAPTPLEVRAFGAGKTCLVCHENLCLAVALCGSGLMGGGGGGVIDRSSCEASVKSLHLSVIAYLNRDFPSFQIRSSFGD